MDQNPISTGLYAAPLGEDADREFRRLVALVVDDSTSLRKMLVLMLKKWNFDVLEASDGDEALKICTSREIDFVISDWMMPGMSGPELCRAVRALDRKNYIYFILLTSKSGKNEVAAGLDAGADDFLVKPTDIGELHARLRAGQRLVRMQDDLVDKNRRISEAFDRLNALYEGIERDLRAASKLQKSLIPDRQTRCGPVPIGIAYQPSGHVGGDLVGFFQVSDSRIAAYAIDVSGHGVSSALMTARLSNFFTPQHLDENIAIRRLPNGEYHPRDPSSIARELNERLQDEADNDQYFTMLFADVNLDTGMVRFCQAGHPNPLVIRRKGDVEFFGEGGPPIGLMPDMAYETDVLHLVPGDRFMIYSDGITECEDPKGEMLENEGLAEILVRHPCMGEKAILDHVVKDLAAFSGNEKFADDISALIFTMP
ncbi:MAG: SpoIIE family protein phosphatase [Pseudomonadota bacterium]